MTAFHITIELFLHLFLGGFCAVFVDSIAGRGRLIALPVLLSVCFLMLEVKIEGLLPGLRKNQILSFFIRHEPLCLSHLTEGAMINVGVNFTNASQVIVNYWAKA